MDTLHIRINNDYFKKNKKTASIIVTFLEADITWSDALN